MRVGIGRRGYIDSVHFRVVNQLLRIHVPPWHTVARGVVLCFGTIPPHHGHQLRMFHLLKRRPAFNLGYVPCSDYSPFYFHSPLIYGVITATLSPLALP